MAPWFPTPRLISTVTRLLLFCALRADTGRATLHPLPDEASQPPPRLALPPRMPGAGPDVERGRRQGGAAAWVAGQDRRPHQVVQSAQIPSKHPAVPLCSGAEPKINVYQNAILNADLLAYLSLTLLLPISVVEFLCVCVCVCVCV